MADMYGGSTCYNIGSQGHISCHQYIRQMTCTTSGADHLISKWGYGFHSAAGFFHQSSEAKISPPSPTLTCKISNLSPRYSKSRSIMTVIQFFYFLTQGWSFNFCVFYFCFYYSSVCNFTAHNCQIYQNGQTFTWDEQFVTVPKRLLRKQQGCSIHDIYEWT